MKTINRSHHKYLTTLGKHLLFCSFVLFFFQPQSAYSQGAYKIGIGIHTSDYKEINSSTLNIANKNINYHGTVSYRLDLPLLFAEAGLGLDVDRYQVDSRSIQEYKVIMPITAGVKLFMFDIKTGVMGRLNLNKHSIINQMASIDQLTFQYLTGVNVRFERLSIGIDYLSSHSLIVEKIIKTELTIDNSVRNRLFATVYYKF